ncbi:type II secretion protein F [Georgenia sp. MJ206]|uniref:type II secretion system F family protein n=1 Tax=Georgenia wangjunii TaxID=3117730 RepID=UPI002F266F94
MTEVATRLRSGASAEAAWAQTFARAGLGGGARVERRTEGEAGDAAPAGGSAVRTTSGGLGAGRAGRADDGVPPQLAAFDIPKTGGARRTEEAALAATVAACRLTHELGAPLADVLDRCAHGISEASQAQDARRIALAGPRSTARLLGWLPAVGLLFGAGLGADPVGTLLDGSWGTASLLTGAGLLAAGHRWTRALVVAAERGGERA